MKYTIKIKETLKNIALQETAIHKDTILRLDAVFTGESLNMSVDEYVSMVLKEHDRYLSILDKLKEALRKNHRRIVQTSSL